GIVQAGRFDRRGVDGGARADRNFVSREPAPFIGCFLRGGGHLPIGRCRSRAGSKNFEIILGAARVSPLWPRGLRYSKSRLNPHSPVMAERSSTSRTPAIRVRGAALSDLDALMELEQQVFATDRMSRRSLRHFLCAPTARVIVAE